MGYYKGYLVNYPDEVWSTSRGGIWLKTLVGDDGVARKLTFEEPDCGGIHDACVGKGKCHYGCE